MASSADESYRYLAAKYVRKQAKQLTGQLDGVRRAEDIECVHQARVAARRLRAAMRVFRNCFPRRKLKRWRKQIRRVIAELGEARDRDVQIEFLCGVLDSLEERACYPGIARLLVQLEQQRELLQPKVTKAVDRLQGSRVLEEMQAVGKRVLSEAKAREVSLQSPFAYRRTGKQILRRLDQLLAYQDSLADPRQIQRHHAMRIAAKRLRYTVEICKPVYQGQLDETLVAVKKVQTLLGDVHDCDVWLEHLEAFATAEREQVTTRFGNAGPFARLQAGIEYLQQERRKQRREVFRELVDYWQELRRQGHWEKLAGTVHAHGKQPAEPQQPAEATSHFARKPPSPPNKQNERGDHENPAGKPGSGVEESGESRQQIKVAEQTIEQEALRQ